MNAITKRRAKCGLTQIALARIIGVQRGTLNRWENGRKTPNALNAEALRRVLGGVIEDYRERGV